MFTVRSLAHPADRAGLHRLRWEVLRPGLPETTAHFVGDDDPETMHFVAVDDTDTVIGCATVIASDGLQLRGMATAPAWRGKGVGKALVAAVQALALERGLPLWCNARESASGFYASAGWEIEGERFDVPHFGPHYIMRYRGQEMERWRGGEIGTPSG